MILYLTPPYFFLLGFLLLPFCGVLGQKEAAIWYFGSGRVYEHTNYHYGKKDGLTKRYYESGELMEEITYNMGEELPGTKKYDRSGKLLSE